MEDLRINRKCELMDNDLLFNSFMALNWDRDLSNEYFAISQEIEHGSCSESWFKEHFFTQNFDWIKFTIISFIVSIVICAICWNFNSLLTIFIIFLLSIFIQFKIAKYIFWHNNKNAMDNFYSEKEIYNNKKAELLHRQEEIKNDIKLIQKFLDKNGLIPFKYRDYWYQLFLYFKEGRADTMKEALNLLDMQLMMQKFEKTVERQQKEIKHMREEHTEALQNLEKAVDLNTLITILNKN